MEEGKDLGGYRLIRRLGTGGAGTVWLAEDEGGTRVALKAMHPALATSDDSRARLERETRTVNSVRSPFVAHIVDAEIDASQPFVVSEYVEGPTLAEILSSGPIPLRGVAALSYHLASTIAAVHHANIIHRDIKPSNIICSSRGPVLIDFGIAMAVDDQHLTRTGLVSGSAGYTAPELLRGKPATKESDWWAWCATLLSCATGRPPFGKGDVMATMMRVIEGEPDLSGLHPMVADALGGGLSANPDLRPSPSLIVAHLMSAVGWAPGELDYVTVNWAQLLDTGERTQSINSEPQEIAAPPEWEEMTTSRPGSVGARAVTYPVHPRRDPSEFTAANDHTEQVDTESVSWGKDEWEDSAVETVWDEAEEASDAVDDEDSAWDGEDEGWVESEDAEGEDWDESDEGEDWDEGTEGESAEELGPYDRGSHSGQPGAYPGRGASYAAASGAYAPLTGSLSGRPAPMGAPRSGLPAPTGAPRYAVPGAAGGPNAGSRIQVRQEGQPVSWQPRSQSDQDAERSNQSSFWGEGAWISGGVVLVTLASLPLLFGLSGTLIVGVALTAFGLVGAIDRWLEKRRAVHGPRSTALRVQRSSFWLSDPAGAIIVWALAAVMVVTAWLMPFASDLRVGVSRSMRSLIRPVWGRGILVIVCVGFLLISWMVGTGGMSH